MSTERETSLAKAISRLSGADLGRFVDFISHKQDQYNLRAETRYWLQREVLGYAKTHGGEEQP